MLSLRTERTGRAFLESQQTEAGEEEKGGREKLL